MISLTDFKINDSGDIILDEVTDSAKFKIQFGINKANMFKVSFDCKPIQIREENLIDKFHIQFKTANLNDSLVSYKAKMVSDLEETAQLVKMRLRTSEEESGRDSLNSTLQKLKHTMNIDSSDLYAQIETLIANKINDIIDNPIVTAVYKKGTGNFYCQNISVSIYNQDNDLIYEYTV